MSIYTRWEEHEVTKRKKIILIITALLLLLSTTVFADTMGLTLTEQMTSYRDDLERISLQKDILKERADKIKSYDPTVIRWDGTTILQPKFSVDTNDFKFTSTYDGSNHSIQVGTEAYHSDTVEKTVTSSKYPTVLVEYTDGDYVDVFGKAVIKKGGEDNLFHVHSGSSISYIRKDGTSGIIEDAADTDLKNAGVYTVYPNIAEGQGYKTDGVFYLSIVPKVVNGQLNAPVKIYDGSDRAFVPVTITDHDWKAAADNVTVGLAEIQYASKNAGTNIDINMISTADEVLSGSEAYNYKLSLASTTGNATIEKKELTVAVTENELVWGTNDMVSLVYDGFVNGETVQTAVGAFASPVIGATEDVSGVPNVLKSVGSRTETVDWSLVGGTNYKIKESTGSNITYKIVQPANTQKVILNTPYKNAVVKIMDGAKEYRLATEANGEVSLYLADGTHALSIDNISVGAETGAINYGVIVTINGSEIKKEEFIRLNASAGDVHIKNNIATVNGIEYPIVFNQEIHVYSSDPSQKYALILETDKKIFLEENTTIGSITVVSGIDATIQSGDKVTIANNPSVVLEDNSSLTVTGGKITFLGAIIETGEASIIFDQAEFEINSPGVGINVSNVTIKDSTGTIHAVQEGIKANNLVIDSSKLFVESTTSHGIDANNILIKDCSGKTADKTDITIIGALDGIHSRGDVIIQNSDVVATGHENGISVDGNLTIQNNSHVTATGQSQDGIHVTGNITIDSSYVTAHGAEDGIDGRGAITITNSTVDAIGDTGKGIYSEDTLTIKDSTVTAAGGEAAIQSGRNIVIENSTVSGDNIVAADSVTIINSKVDADTITPTPRNDKGEVLDRVTVTFSDLIKDALQIAINESNSPSWKTVEKAVAENPFYFWMKKVSTKLYAFIDNVVYYADIKEVNGEKTATDFKKYIEFTNTSGWASGNTSAAVDITKNIKLDGIIKLEGSTNNSIAGWITSTGTITAEPGYLISYDQQTWTNVITLKEEGIYEVYTFYIKKEGESTYSVCRINNILLDYKSPVTNMKSNLKKLEINYKIPNNYTLYTNKNIELKVDADFGLSGRQSIKYKIVKKGEAFVDEDKMDKQTKNPWKEVIGRKISIKNQGAYRVYIKYTDNAGNFTCDKTVGVVLDKVKPTITGVTNKKVYKSCTIQFNDKLSGIKKATLNGKTIKSGKKVSKPGKYTLKVTDKAGNTKTITFTVKK